MIQVSGNDLEVVSWLYVALTGSERLFANKRWLACCTLLSHPFSPVCLAPLGSIISKIGLSVHCMNSFVNSVNRLVNTVNNVGERNTTAPSEIA
jgi:hypothetical protein